MRENGFRFQVPLLPELTLYCGKYIIIIKVIIIINIIITQVQLLPELTLYLCKYMFGRLQREESVGEFEPVEDNEGVTQASIDHKPVDN